MAVVSSSRRFRSARSSWTTLPVQTSTRRASGRSSRSASTVWKRPAVRSSTGELLSACRSMLLGVKTTSGLRHARSAWRRSMWKYCAAVEGWHICRLSSAASCRNRSMRRVRVLRALPLVAVRQQHHQAREQAPLVLAGAEELVDDHLRAVGEIAELRLPQDERFRVVAAVAVLEREDGRLRERRVVDLARPWSGRDVRERQCTPARSRCRSAPRGAG